jgi:peptidoglycan/xylan/chitin deacetylase (PgdA/CDA1 family)
MSRALILMYHLVDTPRSSQESRFCTTPADFARQMEYLLHAGYRPLSLAQIHDSMQGLAPMPDRAVHITFDDGFTCVLEHAAPILARHRIPATMFALSDRLGASNDWMKGRGFPERPLLPVSGLRALEAAGFAIGSHSRTHACLPDVPLAEMQDEVRQSKSRLEDALGKAVVYFAYPFGRFSEAVREEAVAAGYEAACSTRSGFNRPGEDHFLLRRIDVYGTDHLWQFKQKLTLGINDASRSYPVRYLARRVIARLGL